MNRPLRPTQQVVFHLTILGLFSLGVLALALYRGLQSAQFNQDVNYVGRLRASALLVYIAQNSDADFLKKESTLAQMRQQILTLQDRYPQRSGDLIDAWRVFYQQANHHAVTWKAAQYMANTSDQFSRIISQRADAEARNGYWMLFYGALSFLLLLVRGFILTRELRRAEGALRNSERRFAILSEATFEGIALSERGVIKDANSQFAKLLGYDVAEIIGRNLIDFVHPQHHDRAKESIYKNSEETYELVCVRKDKSTFPAEISPRVLRQPNGRQMRLTVGRDITQRKQMEQSWQETNKNLTLSKERWRTLATLDSLTGAYTRRALHRILSREIRRSGHSGMPFSVMMLDLDNFKTYNDTYGHLAGDEVLRHVVVLLRNTLRNVDIVARYGGDEFIIVLVDTSPREAKAVAHKCLQEIRDVSWFKRGVTASLGVLTCRIESGTTMNWSSCQELTEEILRRIDQALYQSKDGGRDQVTVAPDFCAGKKRSNDEVSNQPLEAAGETQKEDTVDEVLA